MPKNISFTTIGTCITDALVKSCSIDPNKYPTLKYDVTTKLNENIAAIYQALDSLKELDVFVDRFWQNDAF